MSVSLSLLLFGRRGFDYRPACFFPGDDFSDFQTWSNTELETLNSWIRRHDQGVDRLNRVVPELRRNAGNLLWEAYLTGVCFWAWNALASLASLPHFSSHTDLWLCCNGMNSWPNWFDRWGDRWEGERDFFSFRFAGPPLGSVEQTWRSATDGQRSFAAGAINLWSDADVLNAARPLLDEPEPTPAEWSSWQKKLLWLQFDNVRQGRDDSPAQWIPGLPAFVPNRDAYYRAICRHAWKRARLLDGTNRPPEPSPTDALSVRQALDALAKWCEPYLPAGMAEPLAGQAEPTNAPAHAGPPAEQGSELAKRPKRSTERGEGRAKLIAALTLHHRYADGSCFNSEPIGNNELARRAEVSTSTAKGFFDEEFGGREREKGHAKYKIVCRDVGRLVDSLKALNGEFSPHDLYGRRPPGEEEREEDE
jgi:hypothetical protein